MSELSIRRGLASEPDFMLGYMTVSPSTGRVITLDEEVRVEALTMAVLVTLARAGGATVPRETLVEACWQGRIVSDDAVARAIAKVRALERCTTPAPFSLETVPKVGYRLLTAYGGLTSAPGPETAGRPAFRWPSVRIATLGAAVVVASAVALVGAWALRPEPAAPRARLTGVGQIDDTGLRRAVRAADVQDAVLALDEARLRDYLARGWKPDWKLDSEGNTALHNLMMACERNPAHDRQAVVRTARLLVEAGADPSERNRWNDTPLIIAAAPRYCGPRHPVTAYLESVVAARVAR